MTTAKRTTSDKAVADWILFTGQPGSGKTTAVKRIVDFLRAHGERCQGFYTDEVLDPKTKSRIGFDVVTVPDGKRGVLSRKAGFGLQTSHMTGKYFVDVASFEAIALPCLATTRIASASGSSPSKKSKLEDGTDIKNTEPNNCILVLDEIGRMELHSTKFSDRVRELLDNDSENARLIGAITAPIYGHRVPFCDDVAARPGVEVHKLTKKTRDGVVGSMLQSIKDRGWVVKTKNEPGAVL